MKVLRSIAYLSIVAFCSCSLPAALLREKETIIVTLPTVPPIFAMLKPGETPSYTVRWDDSDGNGRLYKGVREDITLTIETGVFNPILVILDTEELGFPSGFLPPAGALYPQDGETNGLNGRIETSWIGGISANLASKICQTAAGGYETGRLIASRFNWNRFEQIVGLLPSPENLESEIFVEAVLSGKMTISTIKTAKTAVISFEPSAIGVPDGEYHSAWPDKTPFYVQANKNSEIEVPEGSTHFFGKKGYITVVVSNKTLESCQFSAYQRSSTLCN
jgi:hypothetical protein